MNGRATWARILTLVGVAGPIYYVTFVTLLGFLWNGYDPIRQTQSELGAVDAPHGLLMNVAGFMGLGAVILAFAGAYHPGPRSSPWTPILWMSAVSPRLHRPSQEA